MFKNKKEFVLALLEGRKFVCNNPSSPRNGTTYEFTTNGFNATTKYSRRDSNMDEYDFNAFDKVVELKKPVEINSTVELNKGEQLICIKNNEAQVKEKGAWNRKTFSL